MTVQFIAGTALGLTLGCLLQIVILFLWIALTMPKPVDTKTQLQHSPDAGPATTFPRSSVEGDPPTLSARARRFSI